MNLALSPLQEDSETVHFLRDVLEGLAQEQKILPCKYLYDEAGSRIFEQICELEDYYLTRTEAAIFIDRMPDMVACIGPHALVIEPGAGNCEKVEPLLEHLQSPAGYLPIDISSEILLSAKARIEARLPGLTVRAGVGDFTNPQVWRSVARPEARKQVIFFPGSTIGNFDPQQALQLLRSFAAQLRPGDGLLIGADLDKDPVTLERAYHDCKQVTARFNKNLLTRINRELQGTFNLSLFAHRAFYHPLHQRVEMHLVSLKPHNVFVAGREITFREGETIHTENSHKYSLDRFGQLLTQSGFSPLTHWTDPQRRYAIHYAQVC